MPKAPDEQKKPSSFRKTLQMTVLALMMGAGMYYMWYILGVRSMDVYGSFGIAGLLSLIDMHFIRR